MDIKYESASVCSWEMTQLVTVAKQNLSNVALELILIRTAVLGRVFQLEYSSGFFSWT